MFESDMERERVQAGVERHPLYASFQVSFGFEL